MTSSEIHVQEVLNNLVSATNSIKRDGIDNLDESFTAAIATAAQAQAQAQAQTSAQQAQEQHDHHQVNQEELERIAQEHQHQTQTQEQGQDSQAEQSNLSAPANENSVIHVNALDAGNSSTLATVPITTVSPAPPSAKPVTGSEEWHKMRRDNHKEVERRRRENINAGINDLASVIPNPDKNKGAILRQAVKYIHTIQEAQQKAVADSEALASVQFERDRALLEKNMAQNQLHTLIAENDQLKRDYEALRKEFEELEESKKRQRTE
ncbi:basic helix-loop-helix protein [Entomortierella chlamydospora]|uniref:Basic helix-loop-helix protein n=1 Tax=Entomortierella chlamydospora TaxID=101097 RepID=A0A9P6N2Q2_9FUNG|nr:basic helix-loop-helix protein [Entomortierella chlamydospora]